jgi:aspartate kinase
VSHEDTTDLSFTTPRADLPVLRSALESLTAEIGAERFTIDDDIAKVSLVGAGMKSHPGVAADMFDALATEGINIEMISTSEVRITCMIAEDELETALKALHAAFELERPEPVALDAAAAASGGR